MASSCFQALLRLLHRVQRAVFLPSGLGTLVEALPEPDFFRVVLLQIRQIHHEQYKVRLFTVVVLVRVVVDYVLVAIGQHHGEIVEVTLVVRIRQKPVKCDVRNWLFRAVRVAFDFIHGFFVGYHKCILFFHVLVFRFEPLFVRHFERIKKVRQILIDFQTIRTYSKAPFFHIVWKRRPHESYYDHY